MMMIRKYFPFIILFAAIFITVLGLYIKNSSDSNSDLPSLTTTEQVGLHEECESDRNCVEGQRCISYYGFLGENGPEFKTCEIRCTTDESCPADHTCRNIADGPGQVCYEKDISVTSQSEMFEEFLRNNGSTRVVEPTSIPTTSDGYTTCTENIPCEEGVCYQYPGREFPICVNKGPCTLCDSGECTLDLSSPPNVYCEI